jgi:ribosomal-protein-alanine N-acetyltransferase
MPATTATIRLARSADAPVLAAMSRDTIEAGLPWRYREPEMLRFMRSPRYNVIVAESAEAGTASFAAGFAVMGYGDTDAYLALLAVDLALRHGGIGRRMLDWLIKTADVAGMETISVELREDNAIARGLYGARGFVASGLRPGGYYGVVNQTRMSLRLRPSAA